MADTKPKNSCGGLRNLQCECVLSLINYTVNK